MLTSFLTVPHPSSESRAESESESVLNKNNHKFFSAGGAAGPVRDVTA